MDWLEILIPLIIIAVYFFGGLAGRKGTGDEEGDPRVMTPEEAEAAAERERAQAEIREQIMRRRREAEEAYEQKQQAAAGGTPPPPPVAQSARQQPRPMNRPTNIPQAPARPERPQAPTEPAFSWEENRATQNPFAEQMAARRKQIQETERKAAALRSKHGLDKPRAAKSGQRQLSRKEAAATASHSIDSGLRALLSSPTRMRTAFVLAEIVDKPVSLRSGERKV